MGRSRSQQTQLTSLPSLIVIKRRCFLPLHVRVSHLKANKFPPLLVAFTALMLRCLACTCRTKASPEWGPLCEYLKLLGAKLPNHLFLIRRCDLDSGAEGVTMYNVEDRNFYSSLYLWRSQGKKSKVNEIRETASKRRSLNLELNWFKSYPASLRQMLTLERRFECSIDTVASATCKLLVSNKKTKRSYYGAIRIFLLHV